MGKIVVIGSANTDLEVKTDRMPAPGETILGGRFMMTAGGKGANQAVAASRLGGEVTFVARVGCDLFGEQALAGYRSERMDVRHVTRDAAASSGVALICVDAAAENSIVVAPGANERFSPEDVDRAEAEIAAADFVVLQLEIPLPAVVHAAEVAARHGVRVILNPAPAAAIPDELLRRCYLLTPNRSECAMLAGMPVVDTDDAERAADALLARGVRQVVVTLGGEGSLVKGPDCSKRVPARRVEAVDTTAAGDTFNGALAVALSEGRTLLEAVRFATAASSIAVTRMGAQSSVPTRAEVDALMNS